MTRVEALFIDLIESGEAERAARLAAEPEPDVRAEVAALLAAHDAVPAEWLSPPTQAEARDGLEAAADADRLGDRIGAWSLDAVLARGGMGTVYEASRADGAHEQRVALKIGHRARLDWSPERPGAGRDPERDVLARLEHPGIPRLIDGGTTDEGRPWLAMELIRGVPIDLHVTGREAPLRRRVSLVMEAALAVAAAHRALLVHRDLKPANILVEVSPDGAERVRVVDFGLAAPEQAGAVGLSPAWASPEQRQGGGATTRTDVYGLGRVLETLYESAVGVDADLRAVARRATAEDPEARHPSVEAFAADLDAWISRRPVSARNGGPVHRLRLLGRRRPVAAIATVLVAITLAAAAVGLESRRREAEAERDAARIARAEADETLRFLESALAQASPYRGGNRVPMTEVLDAAAVRAEADFDGRPRLHAGVMLALARSAYDIAAWDRAEAWGRRGIERFGDVEAGDARAVGVAECRGIVADAMTERGLLGSGDGAEAERLQIEALDALVERLPAGDERTAIRRGRLASTLWSTNASPDRLIESERLYVSALADLPPISNPAAEFHLCRAIIARFEKRLEDVDAHLDLALDVILDVPLSSRDRRIEYHVHGLRSIHAWENGRAEEARTSVIAAAALVPEDRDSLWGSRTYIDLAEHELIAGNIGAAREALATAVSILVRVRRPEGGGVRADRRSWSADELDAALQVIDGLEGPLADRARDLHARITAAAESLED